MLGGLILLLGMAHAGTTAAGGGGVEVGPTGPSVNGFAQLDWDSRRFGVRVFGTVGAVAPWFWWPLPDALTISPVGDWTRDTSKPAAVAAYVGGCLSVDLGASPARLHLGMGYNLLAPVDLVVLWRSLTPYWVETIVGIVGTVVVLGCSLEGVAAVTWDLGSVELQAGLYPKALPLVVGSEVGWGAGTLAVLDPGLGVSLRFD